MIKVVGINISPEKLEKLTIQAQNLEKDGESQHNIAIRLAHENLCAVYITFENEYTVIHLSPMYKNSY